MIRKYNDLDFDEVYKICEKSWQGELELDQELEHFIYKFLTKYHILNNDLSFVDASDKVDAFLFAGYRNDTNDTLVWLNNEIINFSQSNQKIVIEYLNYLEYNHQKVINYMNENDLYLALIASQKRNSGKILLTKLMEIALEKEINVYLWTDETCNYLFYQKLGFTLVEEYSIELQNKKIKTFVYKK